MKIESKIIGTPMLPLDAILDGVAKQAEQFIGDGNEHAAQLFLLRKAGIGFEGQYAVEVIAITPIEGGEAGKDAIAQAIGQLVEPFDAYIFLSEGYYLKVATREEVDRVAGRVKEQPGRIEIFSLHFVSKAGDSRMVTYEIKRDRERAYFGPKEDRPFDQTEGRFANFYLWNVKPGEKGN